jgi:hypothetical protein
VIQHTALSPQDADDDAEIVAPPAPVSDGRDTVNRSRGQRRHTSNGTTVDTPPTKKKMRLSNGRDDLGGDGDGGLLFSNVALSISPSAAHIAAKAKPVRARSTHRRADAVGAASTNHRDLSTDALGGVRCIEPLSGAARCDVSATKVLDRPPLTRKPRAHRFGSH